ncbi:MAG: M20/M25/M40 family metallo-hydrolase [Acidobacteriaceae bacterium]|nr:M20/M25/M40 family metallo-hydrolase [Acidobacteriaceae bacterium]MBV9782165.1 M20/M25/M40 family metallo-hydrolase [Acidobacteriaceae bacterium]
MSIYLAALLLWAASGNQQSLAKKPQPVPSATSNVERALNRISADSLRGNLSFLSSDLLAGRWTPSPGLDIAAEFIASRFRAAGLEPGNGTDYFQLADLTELAKQSGEIRDRAIDHPIIARNVVGVLRGSPGELSNTYVIVSAHYDHIGTLDTSGKLGKEKTENNGDRIFNGANDDGSGTVSVIEIANALAKMKQRPKRSIVFIAFCGEELGELGSLYYTQHPLFPLNRTVADINLEQVGRSDSDIGKGNATLTGYDYTTITLAIQRAAKLSGIHMVKTKETDPYFQASDNYPFALVGIPDLTLATSFNFPDYHGLGDEWQKIDFPEMVKVDRLAARAIWLIANDAQFPEWNSQNEKTAKYRKAAPGESAVAQ